MSHQTDFHPTDVAMSSENLCNEAPKILRARSKLLRIYYNEFLLNLQRNAADKPGRYATKKHVKLAIGDVVAIKLPNCKRVNYPLAVVISTVVNSLDEVTEVHVRKSNREVLNLHVSSLIPVLINDRRPDSEFVHEPENNIPTPTNIPTPKPRRLAADKCIIKNKYLNDKFLI